MFIREDSAITTRNVLWPDESERFAVVGEQYRADAVARMRQYIREQERLTPSNVFLFEDNANPHDKNAVAVLFPFARKKPFLASQASIAKPLAICPGTTQKNLEELCRSGGRLGGQ